MRRHFIRYKKKYIVAQRAQTRKLKKAHKLNVRKFNRVRRHPFYYPALLFFILIGGFVAFVVSPSGRNYVDTSSKIVIISHDGTKQTIPTKETTVGDFLHHSGIKLGAGDVVEPSVNTRIDQDDFRINIYRSKPVEVVSGIHRIYTFSAATTPRSIAQQAGAVVYPEDYLNIVPTTNFLTNGAVGEQIVIDRATPINVNLFGTQTVLRTHAKTVAGLLRESNIKLAADDQVVPTLDTQLTSTSEVLLFHKGTQVVNVTQTIPMPVQTILDNTLAYGTSAVRQSGSNGSEILTYQVNLQNGKEVSRTLLNTVVTQQPVTEIVVQGTNLSGIKGDMALAGIAPTDYQYADYIISHESGWCPTKAQGEHTCPAIPDNSGTSMGYGLCQATPGYKMASAGADWATNPVTQLIWCNGYASRYGGWFGAYNHWLAYHSW